MDGWRGYSVRLEGAKYGVSFGSALAMAISYNTNHSILWAIVHGIFSWIYVVYFALFYGAVNRWVATERCRIPTEPDWRRS